MFWAYWILLSFWKIWSCTFPFCKLPLWKLKLYVVSASMYLPLEYVNLVYIHYPLVDYEIRPIWLVKTICHNKEAIFLCLWCLCLEIWCIWWNYLRFEIWFLWCIWWNHPLYFSEFISVCWRVHNNFVVFIISVKMCLFWGEGGAYVNYPMSASNPLDNQ